MNVVLLQVLMPLFCDSNKKGKVPERIYQFALSQTVERQCVGALPS